MVALDVIGQCPPLPYLDDDPIRNPYYYRYGPGRAEEKLNSASPPPFDISQENLDDSGESTWVFSQDDGDASNSNFSQDDASLSLSGDEDSGAGNDTPVSAFSENMLASSADSLFLAD